MWPRGVSTSGSRHATARCLGPWCGVNVLVERSQEWVIPLPLPGGGDPKCMVGQGGGRCISTLKSPTGCSSGPCAWASTCGCAVTVRAASDRLCLEPCTGAVFELQFPRGRRELLGHMALIRWAVLRGLLLVRLLEVGSREG